MRDRQRRILTLALPIIGGMVSQNILNLVDLAMVGSYGNAAVAAVGVGSFANFLATAFITGLSPGVQAMASRRMGEGKIEQCALPLNGALLIAAGFSVPASVALFFLVPVLFPLLNPDPAVVSDGVPYLQWRIIAMAAVGMNFAFRGYWNGVDLSKLYLKTLVFMHAINIALNWVFIYGNLGAPEMGASGAGLSSAVATYGGTAYYFLLGRKHARGSGFLSALPSRETLATVLRLGVPTGLQQLAFAAGFNVLFWILGHIDYGSAGHSTTDVAAANAIVNLMLVAMLPGLGLGIAAATLVGQALGRRDVEDAYRWGWDVAKIAVIVVSVLGSPLLLAPDLVLSPFLHDPETLAVARAPLRLVGATIGVDAVGMVLMNALMGAGATRVSMVVSVVIQWGLFLPVAFVLGPVLGYGLFPIWCAQVGYRVVVAVAFSLLWRRRTWAEIEV